ncbi:MAG: hypothetical protein ACJ0QL_03685 [Parvicellaceae bacterium]
MKLSKLYLPLIAFTYLISSCNKNEAVSLRWDQTGCANPWDEHIDLDTFTTEGYQQGIYDYLTNEGITVNYISSSFDSSKVELCLACHCKTGEVFEINIPKKDKRKLKRLGRNSQFELAFY